MYISHINIKDFVYTFIHLKIHGKAAFVHYAFVHVNKNVFLLVHSDGVPDWLQLWLLVLPTKVDYYLEELSTSD